MQFNPTSTVRRTQSALCVLAVTVGLAVAPGMASGATAAPARAAAVSSNCAAAKTALAQARAQDRAAKVAVAKARKSLRKAKAAHKSAQVRKAKATLVKASKKSRATAKTVQFRGSRVSYACAAPTSAVAARSTGAKLNLLAVANGLSVGSLDLGQLTSLLDQLIPGVTSFIEPGKLTALLGGFNSAGALSPTDALGLLSGSLSPDQITGLLAGSASPEVVTALLGDVVGQLSGLAGGLPIPANLDPTGLFETFAGIFGGLDPAQLGGLLSMVSAGLGTGGSPLDVTQLTSLLNSLVPGIAGSFSPDQLTSMLGALNGGGLSASTLSNLLGGQFSPLQVTSVLGGTASPDLLGSVIAQVMAQLATAGGGGLTLPGALDLGTLTGLISTVTDLFSGLLGGGGGGGTLCTLLPILCP